MGAYQANPQNYTDTLGHTLRVAFSSNGITLQPPASSTPTISVSLDGNGHVSQVIKNGVTTAYSFSDSGTTRTVTVARAGNPTRKLMVDLNIGEITSDIDSVGSTAPSHHTTSYSYNPQSHLLSKILPEGNSVAYTYDARGNVTQTVATAKPTSTLPAIITTSGFDGTCANAIKCNQPNWTNDALGNETDFTYDPTSGLPTSITSSADPNGVRPQTRISYAATNSVQLVSSISVCRTGTGAAINGAAGTGPFTISGTAACAGTADETITTLAYDGNLQAKSQVLAAGDGTLSVTTSQTYDSVGNVLTTVGALGAAETTVKFYDANRRLLGTVSPDPDGAGVRTPAAVKYTYNADGALAQVQIGTVPDQTANSFNNAFTEAYHSAITLDSYDRPIRVAVVSGGNNYTVSDPTFMTVQDGHRARSSTWTCLRYLEPWRRRARHFKPPADLALIGSSSPLSTPTTGFFQRATTSVRWLP